MRTPCALTDIAVRFPQRTNQLVQVLGDRRAMSRFNGFGWRLTATALVALTGAVLLLPNTAGAAPETNSLSGNVSIGTAVGFNGTVISDSDGSHVRGAFKVNLADGGNITVDATCLQVGPALGGRAAGAGGVVKTSTDPSVPVGSGIVVQAFDSDGPARLADRLEVQGPISQVPGPRDCGASGSGASVTKGKLTIRIGV
jgi:hypothetical protein